MTDSFEPTALEIAVLKEFLAGEGLSLDGPVRVCERDFTGIGVFTHFEASPYLKLGEPGDRRTRPGTDALLNGSEPVGFLVFVEDGVSTFELCDFDKGSSTPTAE